MKTIVQSIPAKRTLVTTAVAAFVSSEPGIATAMVLEEIIVTAQKREESLQDTPVAVTAFTSTAIENKGIDNISDLAEFTPNLVFDTTSPVSGLSSGAVVFIRGIGNTDFSLTTDPGVGLYVDGVYMSRSAGGVLDVLDVERIEVLRGPQGTLFGRNTIGGAINIASRKPSEELQGQVEVTLGEFDRADIRASVDIPFSEQLRSTFAVSSKNRDGFVDRVLEGDELGDEDKLSFRATLVFEPSENLGFQRLFQVLNQFQCHLTHSKKHHPPSPLRHLLVQCQTKAKAVLTKQANTIICIVGLYHQVINRSNACWCWCRRNTIESISKSGTR